MLLIFADSFDALVAKPLRSLRETTKIYFLKVLKTQVTLVVH